MSVTGPRSQPTIFELSRPGRGGGKVPHPPKDALDRIVPRDIHYAHNARWGDGNGFSHVRAALMGPSLTVPFTKKTLLLGTWQQIVLVDFDNRPRRREVVVQVSG